ncbi:hypothetical protein NKJ70_30770 [Mesorhizobium sp. M0092]|uniref:hypothetical protein n=1 Tax=Mesorhizobium sp. M0092 TaxID=2956876 RepID=UPI00333686CC
MNQRIVDALVRAFEVNENCMDANRYTNVDDLRYQRSSVCAAPRPSFTAVRLEEVDEHNILTPLAWGLGASAAQWYQ